MGLLTNEKPIGDGYKPCGKCLIHLLPQTDMGIHNCHETSVCRGILDLSWYPVKVNKEVA